MDTLKDLFMKILGNTTVSSFLTSVILTPLFIFLFYQFIYLPDIEEIKTNQKEIIVKQDKMKEDLTKLIEENSDKNSTEIKLIWDRVNRGFDQILSAVIGG